MTHLWVRDTLDGTQTGLVPVGAVGGSWLGDKFWQLHGEAGDVVGGVVGQLVLRCSPAQDLREDTSILSLLLRISLARLVGLVWEGAQRGVIYGRRVDHPVGHLLESGRRCVERGEGLRELRAVVVGDTIAIGVGGRHDRVEAGIIRVTALGEGLVVEELPAGRQDGVAKGVLAALELSLREHPTGMELTLRISISVCMAWKMGEKRGWEQM